MSILSRLIRARNDLARSRGSLQSTLRPVAARRTRRQQLETLESRVLLSASVVEYAPVDGVAGNGTFVGHTVADTAGNLYTLATAGGGIVKFNTATGQSTILQLPSEANGILNGDLAFGPDGNLWVTESLFNPDFTDFNDVAFVSVLKVDTTGNVLATYALGTSSGLSAPTFGADGNLYVIKGPQLTVDSMNFPTYASQIVELSTAGQVLNAFNVPTAEGGAAGLAAGADGSIYFVTTNTSGFTFDNQPYLTHSHLGVIRNGTASLIDLSGNPAVNVNDQYDSLTVDAYGDLWIPGVSLGDTNFPTGGQNQLVKVHLDSSLTPTTTVYTLPGDPAVPTVPYAATIATDGNVYLPESWGSNVTVFNLVTQTASQVAIPWAVANAAQPFSGPAVQVGNAVYFYEAAAGQFARIDLPVTGTGLAIAGLAGQPTTGTLAVLNTTLTSAQIAGLTATVTWGDGHTSAATLVDNGNGTVGVVGTHTYAAPGYYDVDVVVSGATIDPVLIDAGASVVPGVTFAASGVALAPQGEDASFTALVASFVGPTAAYTASINWGNGVTTAGQVVLVNGVYQVIGTGSYATQGNYNISVTISGGSNTATVASSVQVTDTPLVVTGSAPVVLLNRIAIGTTAYFTDDTNAVAGNYTASINWGDGKASAGVVVATGTPGRFLVIGLHTYSRRGTYTLTTTVNTVRGEDAGATASGSVLLKV